MLSERELTQIYDLHSHDLYVFIYGFLLSKESAEDVTHDVFIRLIEYSDKKKITGENVRPVLFTIARNLCIDILRRNKYSVNTKPELVNLSSNESIEENVELTELHNKITALLDELDTTTRSVFLLRKELQIQFKEIAHTLKISERTAKRKMEKALNFLHKKLKEKGYLDDFDQ